MHAVRVFAQLFSSGFFMIILTTFMNVQPSTIVCLKYVFACCKCAKRKYPITLYITHKFITKAAQSRIVVHAIHF
jgi:hypothetical protein